MYIYIHLSIYGHLLALSSRWCVDPSEDELHKAELSIFFLLFFLKIILSIFFLLFFYYKNTPFPSKWLTIIYIYIYIYIYRAMLVRWS
jgi:hypothetical protein